MNKTIFSLALALTARSVHADWMDGLWDLKGGFFNQPERECSSGATPSDRFRPGRDAIMLNIRGDQVTITTLIEGQLFYSTAKIDQNHLEISTEANGKTTRMPITIDGKGVISIYDSGFGPGGTCPIGDTLRARFRKR